jgi:hypothetical protein
MIFLKLKCYKIIKNFKMSNNFKKEDYLGIHFHWQFYGLFFSKLIFIFRPNHSRHSLRISQSLLSNQDKTNLSMQ